MKRRGRAAAPEQRAAVPSAKASPPAAGPVLRAACYAAPLAAAVALAWSLRGAPLGTPAADDFEFLSRVVFHRPLDWLDSMGASYYWRPLSRQAWFTLVTPLLLAAPGAIAAIHLALLGAIAFVLARLARPLAGAPGAALVAAAVLAAEPARTLLTWPSGVQHLLAALALGLAAHEALAGRRWTAALAAAAAAVAHELGAFAFAFVALGGVLRGARGRAALPDAALGLGLAAAWGLAYRAALAHGVQLPEGGLAKAAGAWGATLRLGAGAALDAEALPALLSRAAVIAGGLLFAAALAALILAPRRRGLDPAALPVVATLALACAALLPLGALLPDWNAWRAFVPLLAAVFAITLACARAHPALGLAFVVVRIAALAAAEPASRATETPPPGVSDFSFARLTRVQSTLAASAALVREASLAPDRRVAYWGLPAMTLNGFRDSLAVRVWSRDPAVRFVPFEGRAVITHPPALVLSYDTRPGREAAVAIRAEALAWMARAMAATDSGRDDEAREAYRRTIEAQHPESPSLSGLMLHDLAITAVGARRYAEADSFLELARRVRGTTPDALAVTALIAIGRGDLPRAQRFLDACLKADPTNYFGMYVRGELERLRRERPAPPAPAGR